MQNLNMSVNDKMWTDLDLHKWSNLGMGVYITARVFFSTPLPPRDGGERIKF